MNLRLHTLAIALAAGVAGVAEVSADTADPHGLIEAGRRIYQEGVLISGQPLRGLRAGGTATEGADAACIQCHRRSGMGVREGRNVAPPITGPNLFGRVERAVIGRQARRAPGVAYKDFPFRTRAAYDDASLAQALRTGISPGGHVFDYLMPRYALGDADMAALTAYLRTLSAVDSPGADRSTAHFATVIAPGADPKLRQATIDVLQACFKERYPEIRTDPRHPGKTFRGHAWKLHVWDLAGPPETWPAQLQQHYRRQPVFALLSGLGQAEWRPVHQYCEQNGLPCLFPNVLMPGADSEDIYSFYLSPGLALDVDVLARHLRERQATMRLKRVLQVASGAAGNLAAARLRDKLADSGIVVERLDGAAEALRTAGDGDALALWLPPAELAGLHGEPPRSLVYLAGTLSGADRPPLPAPWRPRLRIIHPYDAPGNWAKRMRFNLQPWLTRQGIEDVDTRLQGNTLTACNLTFEAMLRLEGRYLRDYLVENLENYSMGNQAAPAAFPRFSLGPGQRYGSKGAYIIRFGGAGEPRIVRDSDWIVP
jgi:hypothetical protein